MFKASFSKIADLLNSKKEAGKTYESFRLPIYLEKDGTPVVSDIFEDNKFTKKYFDAADAVVGTLNKIRVSQPWVIKSMVENNIKLLVRYPDKDGVDAMGWTVLKQPDEINISVNFVKCDPTYKEEILLHELFHSLQMLNLDKMSNLMGMLKINVNDMDYLQMTIFLLIMEYDAHKKSDLAMGLSDKNSQLRRRYTKKHITGHFYSNEKMINKTYTRPYINFLFKDWSENIGAKNPKGLSDEDFNVVLRGILASGPKEVAHKDLSYESIEKIKNKLMREMPVGPQELLYRMNKKPTASRRKTGR